MWQEVEHHYSDFAGWGQLMISNAEKSLWSNWIKVKWSEKVLDEVKKWWWSNMKWLDFLFCMHSIMMILWGDLKSEMKRSQFLCCMQCKACLHCMDVCELHILCCQAISAMLNDFLQFLVGSESPWLRLVRLHRCCSQVGQVLIMTY